MTTSQNDNTAPLEPLRKETGLARRSGFLARRVRELAQQVRELDLGDDVEVVFPDKNLEGAVREALEKPEGPLTKRDLKRLKRLKGRRVDRGRGRYRKIKDLTGLENATNLALLELVNNQISDANPLAYLSNLRRLFIGNNHISDVSPLASLTNLTWLHLNGNQISDVSPLVSLSSLTVLNLTSNDVNDVNPLTSLNNLRHLYLNDNPLSRDSKYRHIPKLKSKGVDVRL